MDRDAIKLPSGFDSSRAEFFIEFKTGSESDLFKSSQKFAMKNMHNEILPMDMAPYGMPTEVVGQITAYSTLILSSQYHMHTFLVLVLGEYARLFRWDRAGAVVSDKIYYNKNSSLLDFLVSYNNASPAMRGHDDTICDSTRGEDLEA